MIKALPLIAALLLSGCATAPASNALGMVDGRKVEYAISGSGSPVVVFESGMGGHERWWSKVLPLVKSTTLVYNRPGIGRSSPSQSARTGENVVADLRKLLQSQHLSPPYILVGHSLGGLYMQYFARRYPDEVAGLVLVDSTHPRQLSGEGSPENWTRFQRAVFGAIASDVAEAEWAGLDQTGQSVLSLPAIPGDKVVVLSSGKLRLKNRSPQEIDANNKRADIANLYPGSRQVWVDAGHVIPVEDPDAIAREINALLSP